MFRPGSKSSLRPFVAAAAFALGCGGNIGGLKDGGGDPVIVAPVPDAHIGVEPVSDAGMTDAVDPLTDGAVREAHADRAVGATYTTCEAVGPTTSPSSASCASEARMCAVTTPDPFNTCATPDFGPSLNRELGDCGIMCVSAVVGVIGGCVTEVLSSSIDPDGNAANREAVACASKHLLGTRWPCAPQDGRYHLVFGACVIIN